MDRIYVQLCVTWVQLFGAPGPGVDVGKDYGDNHGMSLETIIQFVMNHNAALIESLIALILLAVLFLSFRAFKGAAEGASAGLSGDLGALEETLKKLLAQASLVPAVGSAVAADSSGVTKELISEIEILKGSLQDKQAEIEKIKASAAAAPAADSGFSDDMRAKLEAQLKELKGKLEEYEIISEDIADLSFYKEENAKLLKQLEGAKSGAASGSVAAAAAPMAEPAPPAAVEVAAAPLAPEAPPAPAEAVVVSAPPEAPPAPAAIEAAPPVEAVSAGVDDDLMAEFAKAVQAQNSGAEPEAVASSGAPSEGEADLGSMDLEKISAEAEGIIAAGSDSGDQPNALEATLDTDKLIQEASDLTSVKAEDKKLMNEFENFVKGS